MSEARIATLEAKITALETALEKFIPKPTELELLFPGAWEKRWSGKGNGWDASGTEVFEVKGDTITIRNTTGGARTSWNVDVKRTGKVIHLRQTHTREQDHVGFAPVVVEIAGDPESGYTGIERGDYDVVVEYARFVGPLPAVKPKRQRSPEEWREIAARRKAVKTERARNRGAV